MPAITSGAAAPVTGGRAACCGETAALLAAVLKAFGRAAPIDDVRVAASYCIDPKSLMPLLSCEERLAWCSVVGSEVLSPRPFNAPAWQRAVTGFRGRGRMVEDLENDTWAPAPSLDAIDTSGWPDRRARFVLRVMARGGEQG
jgi:hypothetical protein